MSVVTYVRYVFNDTINVQKLENALYHFIKIDINNDDDIKIVKDEILSKIDIFIDELKMINFMIINFYPNHVLYYFNICYLQ